jgi:Fe-S-cluster-containing dehydrogenase component/CRP-like cAMP-binding protein
VPRLHLPPGERAGHRRLMSKSSSGLNRPRRWDVAFSKDMSQAGVARIMKLQPFCDMDPEGFPKSAQLQDILKNDARLRQFEEGEIIVREGDYGNTAFMVLSGSAQVVLSPGLPPGLMGRSEPTKRGFFRALAQLWSNSGEDEQSRDGGLDAKQSIAHSDTEPGVVLQDLPRVLGRQRTATIMAGDVFGEIAALSRMPRTATIVANKGGAEMLEIRWQGLRDLMRYDPKVRAFIDGIYRERALSTYLEEMPFMRYLGPEAKKRLMDATQFETYGDYDWSGEYKQLVQSGATAAQEPTIAVEGDYPNSVVMIRAGFARMTQRFGSGHRTLNYLGSGRMYGFEEIAHNWRKPENHVSLQHTLRVIGYTHVLVIPAAIIEEVVLPAMPKSALPALIEDSGRSKAPFAATSERSSAESQASADVMEFVTQNRFFNGTKTMVIDLDRCTRCDDCVRACAATHDNNPRFLRHGPVHNNLMVAQACMHCTDPICMIGCPTGAIHRETFDGNVVINPSSCIGCSACANNCPYGAIRMVEIRDASGRILVASDSNPIHKATKCDLCNDQYGGPACERACPHDALKRINLNTLDDLVSWIQR